MKTREQVAPGSDPKWILPPSPSTLCPSPVSQSRPLPHHTMVRTAEEAVREHENDISIGMDEERLVAAPDARPDGSSPTRPQRSTHNKYKRGRPILYTFNQKDDVYISKRRIDGDRWEDIKEGKNKWKKWPLHAFHSHWRLIKDRSLHLHETNVTSKDNSGGVVSRKQVHHRPKPLPNVGKKRDMRGNVRKMDKGVPDDGWSTDELAM
jgi:hypothetical protein